MPQVVCWATTPCGSRAPPSIPQQAHSGQHPQPHWAPISLCGARPPPLSIPVLRGALGVSRGPKPGQRSIARHFTRSSDIRLALLVGTARVIARRKPLVLPRGVSAPEDDVDQGTAKTERGEVPDITDPQRLSCRKPSLRGHFCSTSQQTSFLLKRVRVGFQLH